jgi:type II secretory pathway pseudopilin PulG
VRFRERGHTLGVRFREREPRSGERGYTLVAIMIFMTLIAISILVISPTVSKIMQRDREEELMFRGKQYAQAFLNFQKRQGRFPLTLKELMTTHPRSARKLFKEPMCNCDDWGLIRVGQPWPPPPPGTNPAGTTGTSTGTSPGTTAPGGQQTRPGAPLPGSYSSPPPGNGNPGGGSGDTSGGMNFGGPPKEANNAPIVGVYSKVHKKGLRTFHGQEYYDQWGFIAGANNDPDLPGSLPAGFPGIPNRPPGVNKPPATTPGTSSGTNF